MASVRLARLFNQLVQWGMLFIHKTMVSHLLDEAIRWTEASALADKTSVSIIEAIATQWINRHGPMKTLVADGEGG